MTTLVASLLMAVAGAAPGAEAPSAARPQVEVTYLANEGFLLRSGGSSVLIDAFIARPYAGSPALPGAAMNQLKQAAAPFDGVDLALVSHGHGDHFQPVPARAFMAAAPEAVLASTPQVIEQFLHHYPLGIEGRERLQTVLPEPGEWLRFEQGGIGVEVMSLSHGTGEFASVQNLGHLIRIGGMTVLHVGDAAIDARSFAPYELAGAGIDVALLPYWYWLEDGGPELVATQLKAEVHVACHLHVETAAEVSASLRRDFPEVVLFERPLETRRFERARSR